MDPIDAVALLEPLGKSDGLRIVRSRIPENPFIGVCVCLLNLFMAGLNHGEVEAAQKMLLMSYGSAMDTKIGHGQRQSLHRVARHALVLVTGLQGCRGTQDI